MHYICTLMDVDVSGCALLLWCTSATASRASIVKASLLAPLVPAPPSATSWKSLKSELAPEPLDTLWPSTAFGDAAGRRRRRYTTTARMPSAMVTMKAHAARVMRAMDPLAEPALTIEAPSEPPTTPLATAATTTTPFIPVFTQIITVTVTSCDLRASTTLNETQ